MRRKYQGSNRKNWNQYNFYYDFFTGRHPHELQIEVLACPKMENLIRNMHDFEVFAKIISGSLAEPVLTNKLLGPVIVDGIDCFLGKITTH